jgi:hypothetical protein
MSYRSYWCIVGVTISLCTVGYAFLAVAQLGAPTPMTGSTDQYARTQEHLASPNRRKLIYASGSSGFYGVRCRELSSMIGRPAINFGLHAGLGLRFLMDRALAACSPGDVIILGPEWETYAGPRYGEYACDYIMSRRPHYLASLSFLERVSIVRSAGPQRVFSGVWNCLRSQGHSGPPSDLSTIVNDHGDRMITPADQVRRDSSLIRRTQGLPKWKSPPAELIEDIRVFSKACQAKDVRLAVTFAPMCVDPDVDLRMVQLLDTGVRELWGPTDTPVLGTENAALYGPDDAFDTPYHLAPLPAMNHTRHLAQLIKDSRLVEDQVAGESKGDDHD